MNEIIINRQSSLNKARNAVYHLVNPTRADWASLIPTIQDMYSVQPVPLVEWVNELEAIQHPSDREVEDKPSLKLLPFFRSMADKADVLSAPVSVDRSKQESKTMAALGPVSPAQMATWLAQWNF